MGLWTNLCIQARVARRVFKTLRHCLGMLAYLVGARVFQFRSFRAMEDDARRFLRKTELVPEQSLKVKSLLEGALMRQARGQQTRAAFARGLRDLNASFAPPPAISFGPRAPGPLRILYVSSMFPSVLHAGGLRLFDLISDQAQRFTIDLYATLDGHQDVPSFNQLRTRLNQIRVNSFERFSGADLSHWLLRRNLEFGHYDVIHFEYPQSGATMTDAAPFGRKLVFTMQECVTRRESMRLAGAVEARAPLGYVFRNLITSAHQERTALANSDASIAVTAGDAEFARRMYGVRAEVVPTGLSDHAVLEPLRQNVGCALAEKPTILFLGYYSHFPNIEGLTWYLENVHPLVKARRPDYVFRIVGRGDLSALQARFESDPCLDFTGEVDDIVLPILTSWACVAPLISGAGFRGKVNQYAIAGKPVVSTSIGVDGMPYTHGETIYKADTPSDFARAIVQIIEDYPRALKVGAAAKDLAERAYSWRAITPHLERLYEI